MHAEFVGHNLGALETADNEGPRKPCGYSSTSSATRPRAAARLYLHRNALLRRLARADELLPRPLAENSVAVAVALDVLRWHGSRTG